MTNTDSFFTGGDVPRDQWGRYKLPPLDGGKPEGRTRVTTFAKAIADTYNLGLWQQRMAIKGLASRSDLIMLAAATPLSDKKTLDDIAERAKDAAGANVGRDQGTAVHAFTEQVSHGTMQIEDVPDLARPAVESYFRTLADNGIEEYPQYIERVVLHVGHNVAGTFDRLWRLPNGDLVVGDIKTSANIEYSWKEIAIQLALYADADAIMNYDEDKYEEMPDVRSDFALVAHVQVDGLSSQTTLYKVDLERGRQAAAICAQARDWDKTNNLATEWQPGALEQEVTAKHVPAVQVFNNVHNERAEHDVPQEEPFQGESVPMPAEIIEPYPASGIDPQTEVDELTKLTKDQLTEMALRYGITDTKRYKRKVAADIVAAKNSGLTGYVLDGAQIFDDSHATESALPEPEPSGGVKSNPFADQVTVLTEAQVSYLDAIGKADSKAEIAGIWQQAIDNGDDWNDELNRAAVQRLTDLTA